ncbi:MAG: hypothetical protein R3297_01235, partial [Desulfobulbales bacterium]|nr:hypothetical protein [Desulfobulbales bacterium]
MKNKKWLGYALYCVMVTLLLLYYLFPAQAVEDFIDDSVRGINPAFRFKAEKIEPWLPAGLQITSGKIHLDTITAPAVFTADNIYIEPKILQLIKGRQSFAMSGAAYRGD